jgi:hypothetical protein
MPRRRRSEGQVLVIFALSIVVLLACAGLAFDVGRFYTEKRFLQNAADAAALAASNALIRGETDSVAIDDANTILTRNFLNDPTGRPPSLPASPPVYVSGHAGDPSYLMDGILISDGEVRVAIQNNVDWTFGRVIGLGQNAIGGRAMASLNGSGILPVVVRHFVGSPGPNTGAVSCTGTESFQDLVATADTACLGTETNATLRSQPSAGNPYNAADPNDDPSHHGPIISLVGQGAQASNSSSFRGFVALDIRDFSSATSNVFYNGVTAGTNSNTLKDIESSYLWVSNPNPGHPGPGYPGPAFPPITSPPDPADQVALTAGNSAGQIVDAFLNRYRVGEEVLCAVYSGTVMTIPDFTMPGPTQPIGIGTTQTRNNSISMSVTKNTAFTGTVLTSAFNDANDSSGTYPSAMVGGLTFTPNPITPVGTVTWATFATSGATAGIYELWIKGHSPSPYLTDHYVPVAVNVGSVGRDFGGTMSPAGLLMTVASTGATATTSQTFNTTNSVSAAFAGAVHLSIEDGPATQTVGGPTGLGTVTFSANDFTLAKGSASQSVTISINSGTLAPGEYALTLRATGTNSAGQHVTHVYPITLDVATAGTSNNYVDIMGFTVFRITSLDANDVMGYAISPLVADVNDAQLRLGQVAKLVPWI